MTILTHNTSSRTTLSEYTSDFSVNFWRRKYSGSKYPKPPFTNVLTWVWSMRGLALGSLKSATFPTSFPSRRIFVLRKVVPLDGGRRLKCYESVERSNGSQLAKIGREAEWQSDSRNRLRNRIGVGWPKSAEKPKRDSAPNGSRLN